MGPVGFMDVMPSLLQVKLSDKYGVRFCFHSFHWTIYATNKQWMMSMWSEEHWLCNFLNSAHHQDLRTAGENNMKLFRTSGEKNIKQSPLARGKMPIQLQNQKTIVVYLTRNFFVFDPISHITNRLGLKSGEWERFWVQLHFPIFSPQ